MIRTAIKTALANRRWLASDLSRETGIRYQTIQDFLQGRKGIAIDHLETILLALGLKIV